jgi:HAD superfamily hydrolase (TIGR01509 family)
MIDCDLVIFDCDGVLIDSEVLGCSCLAEILGKHGLPTSLDEVFDRFLGRSFGAVGDHYQEQTGRPLPDAFASDLRSLQSRRFATSLTPIPHIVEVLSTIDRPYCLASSSDRERIDLSLEVTRLARFFEGRIFSGTQVPRGKPAPDLFLAAAERMGARASRTLVIEDSVNGVLAGKAAGMTVWGFIGGSHYQGRSGAELLAAAGVDRIFDTMADLLPETAAR